MKINSLSMKAIKRQLDHEGMSYIYSSNIYLGNKKIGTYGESYMCGSANIYIEKQYEKELLDIANRYFDKYPNGFIQNLYSFELKDIYKDNLIEGLLTQLGEMAYYEKQAKNAFKKGFKYYVVSKKDKTSMDKNYMIPNDIVLNKHKNENIICFLAEKDKKSFDFLV